MDQAPGRLRVVAVVTAIALPVLAACSAEDPAPAASQPTAGSSSSSGSAERSPAAATETTGAAAQLPAEPEVPRPHKGRSGQKAFARYVMAAWAWSLRANDAGPLLEVSRSRKQPCRGCRPLQKELEKRAKDGWYVDFPGLAVDRTRLRHDGTDVVATSKVDIPESNSFRRDGSYRSSNPAHRNATFTVRMRWSKGEYRLVSFTVS